MIDTARYEPDARYRATAALRLADGAWINLELTPGLPTYGRGGAFRVDELRALYRWFVVMPELSHFSGWPMTGKWHEWPAVTILSTDTVCELTDAPVRCYAVCWLMRDTPEHGRRNMEARC